MTTLYKENCNIIASVEEMIFHYRRQNYYKGNLLESEILDKILAFMNALQNKYQMTTEAMTELLKSLFEAKQNQDYILLTDLYEYQIVPFLIETQNYIWTVQVDDSTYWEENLDALVILDERLTDILRHQKLEKRRFLYNIEDTNIGVKTLKIVSDERSWYLHSNGNPWLEGINFAEEYYEEEEFEYAVLGLGLGYHIVSLWKKNRNIKITVFETDLEVLRLALHYQDFKEILESRKLTILYDSDLKILGEFLKSFRGRFLVYVPALGYIKNGKQREFMEEYFLHLSSIKNQGAKLRENFQRNKKSFDRFVDDLKEEWSNKEIILTAGGPSLDTDLGSIKKLKKGRILVTVGTVFRKLLEEGINPDYVIITDADKGMKKQIEGIDKKDIPLLYLSTISPEVLDIYEGRKYCILQHGFRQAEEYAKENELQLYETGGSVSTTALDLIIRLNHKKVYCFGLDLAYTENKTHAKGTLDYRKVEDQRLRKVKAVDDGFVPTIKNLDSYRHWIERRIEKEREMEFWNISRGAYINGMKNMLAI